MTSQNFSWGIAGFILTILASIIAVVVLALMGYSDPVIYGSLSLLATNSLVALSATMNPNRRFQNEVEEVKDAAHNLRIEAEETRMAARQVKDMLQ